MAYNPNKYPFTPSGGNKPNVAAATVHWLTIIKGTHLQFDEVELRGINFWYYRNCCTLALSSKVPIYNWVERSNVGYISFWKFWQLFRSSSRRPLDKEAGILVLSHCYHLNNTLQYLMGKINTNLT